MNKLHVKKDDEVIVISGNSKGTRGKVIATSPEEGKLIVAGVHIVSKHTKARRQGEASQIVKTEGAIYASKVQLYCPKCKKGVRTKVETKTVGDKQVKVRVCVTKDCGHAFD
ncbi:MAG: 50S ribosomal protein L24 [Ruminococcaceae bacterium]|nr:50S ribosomal protein L24 [Oscillospiraceae bacterium]